MERKRKGETEEGIERERGGEVEEGGERETEGERSREWRGRGTGRQRKG